MMDPSPLIHGPSMTEESGDFDDLLLDVTRISPNGSPNPLRKRTASEDLTPAEKRPKTAEAEACSNQVTTPVSKVPDANPTEKDDVLARMDRLKSQCNADDDGERATRGALARGSDADHIAAEASDIRSCGSSDDDAYPLDEDISDEDILHLLVAANSPRLAQETRLPPSSVQDWCDHGSRSATEFDPMLEYSPPNNPKKTDVETLATAEATRSADDLEDLLDEDVDWNAVMTHANTLHERPSPNSHPEIGTSKSRDASLRSDEAGPLTPFTRPPFPDKVRDRPSVPGMSSDTLLRTCFRVGAMVSQTARYSTHQQDVIFELYARVTYSNRESMVRKQHFQFVDLFKDQHPYPAATLTNWRVGSQVDKDSLTFLDTTGGPRLCRCMCKPMRDPKAAIGWTYTVLSIKPVDWEQVRWVKRYICGDV